MICVLCAFVENMECNTQSRIGNRQEAPQVCVHELYIVHIVHINSTKKHFLACVKSQQIHQVYPPSFSANSVSFLCSGGALVNYLVHKRRFCYFNLFLLSDFCALQLSSVFHQTHQTNKRFIYQLLE